ncbi:hypothetical protein BGX24_004675 [Mortierella sp. AD032]|nr:hypothetical protein BGX24_004675 [Mortierella sp. AD032]
MRSRSYASSATATATVAAGVLFLSTLSTTAADLACQQLGADTFHIGSTLKFTWSDTQTVQIDSFNLNLYCAQTEKFLQTITTLNSTSPATYPWVVNSTIAAFAPSCEYNQYHGAFDWTSSDSETGAVTQNSAKCKVMLMISDSPNSPGAPGSAVNGPETPFEDEPAPSSIVVSDKTKTIVIGVGCAVGLLVLAGIIGFYVIRYSNKRAAEENQSRKLREPIQSGPLFAPMDRNNGGNGGAGRRYNELSSVTTGSETMGHSPATTARTTEMVQLNGATPIGTPVLSHKISSAALGSRSPTPIAAAHAKANAAAAAAAAGNTLTNSPSLLSPRSSIATPVALHYNQDRPSSLLTSPFVPADEAASGRTSPFRHQQQHYQNDIQMQQQNQHQIQQQLQQQQQQQQQAYTNGYY